MHKNKSSKISQNKQFFILQGGPENLEWFEDLNAFGKEKFNRIIRENYSGFYWSIPKKGNKDDEAYIYLTAPVSSIVGRVRFSGEPFFIYPNRFKNAKMGNKTCIEIEFLHSYTEHTDSLHISRLRTLFGSDWGWVRYPRSNGIIPDQIIQPITELTVNFEK